MLEVSIPIAFMAGTVAFFAPCTVSFLPAYIAYILGEGDTSQAGNKSKILWASALYIAGFSLVFVLLGVGAAGIGVFLRTNTRLLQLIGGLVMVVMGLQYAGVLNIAFLSYQKSFSLPELFSRVNFLRPFFFGLIFASVWSPCTSPVLGSILALALNTSSVAQGALLLWTYSLGIALPFLLLANSLAHAPQYLHFLKKHSGKLSRVAGVVLTVIGLLLATDTLKYVNGLF